ncbi:DUF3179 domain-containing protein [Ilumatobacter sp.]|uniref:DUF3179 domain-containing protein n=1 Tax=Ilumatobacter sp. TaxID=1967498 RepID=UPI003AF855C3
MFRPLPLAAAGIFVLSACGATDEPAAAPPLDQPPTESTEAATGTQTATDDEAPPPTDRGVPSDGKPFRLDAVEPSPTSVTASGLEIHRNQSNPDDLPDPLVDFGEVRSGGPPPDGIPPVDSPTFLRVGDVDFLADNEPVLALEIDGDTRAYPVQIMTWHEIVNDTVGGVPVTVSYCPLCNSAVAFDRRLGDRVLDFGTSGLLYNSALVMYDRQTESLWSHFTGEAIIGELTGEDLQLFPVSTVSWATFRDANPDGVVLSRDTGFDRNYGQNPYPGYDNVDGVPFLFQGEVDGRYTALTRIVGIESGEAAVGIPLDDLRAAQVIEGEIDGRPLVALWAAGTSSALQNSTISEGVDVGATGVFVPEANGEALSFTATGEGTFTDDRTGSTWNILGEAVDGELAGEQLDPYVHVDTFWFAWSTFRTDTEVLTG